MMNWKKELREARETVEAVMDDKKPTESLGKVYALIQAFEVYQDNEPEESTEIQNELIFNKVQAGERC